MCCTFRLFRLVHLLLYYPTILFFSVAIDFTYSRKVHFSCDGMYKVHLLSQLRVTDFVYSLITDKIHI